MVTFLIVIFGPPGLPLLRGDKAFTYSQVSKPCLITSTEEISRSLEKPSELHKNFSTRSSIGRDTDHLRAKFLTGERAGG